MDETVAPPSVPPTTPSDRSAAEKLASQLHWPGRLGSGDGWARFADWTGLLEPPARMPDTP